jgi:hypothetical protein
MDLSAFWGFAIYLPNRGSEQFLPIIKIMNPHVYVSPMVEETESLKQ